MCIVMAALFQIRRACGNNRGVVPVLVGNVYAAVYRRMKKKTNVSCCCCPWLRPRAGNRPDTSLYALFSFVFILFCFSWLISFENGCELVWLGIDDYPWVCNQAPFKKDFSAPTARLLPALLPKRINVQLQVLSLMPRNSLGIKGHHISKEENSKKDFLSFFFK